MTSRLIHGSTGMQSLRCGSMRRSMEEIVGGGSSHGRAGPCHGAMVRLVRGGGMISWSSIRSRVHNHAIKAFFLFPAERFREALSTGSCQIPHLFSPNPPLPSSSPPPLPLVRFRNMTVLTHQPLPPQTLSPQTLPPLPPLSPSPPVSVITLASHTLSACPVRSFNLLVVDPSNGLITTHTDGLGYTSGDLAGKRLDVVLNPDSAVTLPPDPSCCDGLGATCEASDGYTLVAGTHKNGTAMWLNVCVHEVAAASGTKPDAPTYHIWLIRDVTRLRWLASLSGFNSTRSPSTVAPTASTLPASLSGSVSPTTVVLRLTRFGVIDSVFPAAFLGVASQSLVNTPVMARVHRADVRTLCRGLVDVHKNSYSTFKVRWRVGGGREGFYCEGDEEEEEEEGEGAFDKTYLDETTASLYSEFSSPFTSSALTTTTTVSSSTYEWVHITAMLSTSTNPSSVNDPICIVRTASSLPPDQLSSSFLIPERYIQQTALDHYRLPAGASALAAWPVTLLAAPVRALWDDLSRALEDGRQYVAEYLAYVVAVVVDALVWMSGVDVKRIASGRSDGQVRAIEGREETEQNRCGPTPSPTTSSSSDEDSRPTTPTTPITPTTESAVALRYRPTAPAASATLKAVLRHVEARPAVQAALGYLERVGLGERSAAIVPYLEKCVDGGCEWLFEGRAKGRAGARTSMAGMGAEESKEK